MDLEYTEEYEAFRASVRAFLAGWPLKGAEAELPLEDQEALFRKRAIEAGFAYRDIPRRYGGSEQPPDLLKDRIIQEEFHVARAPRDLRNRGAGMLAPTLLQYGSEEQKQRYIPPALSGEELWCQGYSEPASGSDLASLQCSARLEGDHWVIRGQKIWTSGAQESHMMFGLFRTEPEAPRHDGISYLLVPMDAPGIEVRPLREMSGGMEFNEVFFDEAKIPAENIVGARGQGWSISRATLQHERNLIGNPFAMREAFEDLVSLAKARTRAGAPAIAEPELRRRLVEIEAYVAAGEASEMRQLSAHATGQVASVLRLLLMNKLFSSETRGRITRCAIDLLGFEGALAPSEAELQNLSRLATPRGWVAGDMLSLGIAIAGGSTNIQLNIIAERGYGLPRDARPPSRKGKA